jgi:hypothetical protein
MKQASNLNHCTPKGPTETLKSIASTFAFCLITKTSLNRKTNIKVITNAIKINSFVIVLEEITQNPESPTRKTLTTLVEKHALELPLKEMTSLLEKQGFKKIESCVKLKDNCIQLPDGRDAPMLLFVHESGVVVRVKPEPIPGQFREKPHSSMMIVKPEKDFAPNLSHISSEKEARKFSDEMLSWDKELVKVDPVSGSLLPKHPGHLKLPDGNDDPELLKVYADAIMERAHPDLHVP